ncbi:MAG: DUF493 family protein [Cryomorphaceae bacterium]|nr:DUF493 family protein [Cryomorphaceae bacterium]
MAEKDPFEGLLEKLKAEKDWPKIYMFKFISPADNEMIAKVQGLFNAKQAQISMRESKKGNYISITVKEMMLSPEGVVEVYRRAATIPGLMSL